MSNHPKSQHLEAFDIHKFGRMNTLERLTTLHSLDSSNPDDNRKLLILVAGTGDAVSMRTLLQNADLAINEETLSFAILMVVYSGMGKAEPEGGLTTLRLLLETGAPPNIADLEGNTPLIVAARNGRIDAVRVLVEHGADINAQNLAGQTAIEAALGSSRLRIQKMLRDALRSQEARS